MSEKNNNTATNNQTLRSLLLDTLTLFENFGVKPGIGQDGLLMARIQEELAGIKTITIITPNGACPVCRAPDMLDCDCDPAEQVRMLNL
jgi:hypothetical protein